MYTNPNTSSGGHFTPPPPPGAEHRHVNGGLLFLFSFFFPPGANYMYMGLIKRGLAAMCGFFFIIFMVAWSTSSSWLITVLFAFAIPVYILTVIFDGFNIRRRINAGEYVEDGVAGIISSILSNKKLCLFILVVLGLIFAGSILGFALNIIRRAIPILIIGFGIYILLKHKKPSA